MGVALSAIRSEVKNQGAEVEKTTNDALNSLVDIAKLQTMLFKTQVKDTSDTTRINVSKFLREDTVIKCSVDYDAKLISDHISKVYKSFANGDIANAIGDVLGASLDALIGSSVANSNEETKYFVTVGKLGYAYRIDMHLYIYSFTSDTLTAATKNVLAVSLMISSVDLTNLTENDLGAIVQVCYENTDEETMRKILDTLLEVWKKQLKQKAKSHSAVGGGKAAFSGGGIRADFGGIRQGLDLDTIGEESHDAWKDAMEEEESIPSYQPPEIPENLRSILDKLY
ncbi:hypothetical protein V494_03758 [Pseudogymnoascus sp. VKM F-4513 (FW-928)]|nr:hypothetical protein V494_03758 [Pseudogymnoascus sp. VKM F-4513 (FW-928)]